MTHIPVLLKETIEILDPKPGEFFIDGTVGSGGHSTEIIKRISPNGIFLGIDWDKKAVEKSEIELKAISYKLKSFLLVHGNYADLPKILKKQKLPKADGLFLDLGYSSTQIDSSGRGFSFMKNEPLNMRYDNKNTETAGEIVNQFSEKDLADIIFKYGEERFSRQIAKKIVEERKKKRILTTFDLVEIIKKAVPKSYERGRIHPATRTFQALRIYANNELENLKNLLKNIDKIVEKGKVAIISFHSLEDRIVKNCFRNMAKEGNAKILIKKLITPTYEEIKQNPRSRSAKLRAIQL